MFVASDGWLDNWKTRYNVSCCTFCGESGNIDMKTAEEWKESLSQICSGYDSADIFNMDKTGYFYRALPTKTLSQKGSECKGEKLAKDQITLAFTCSMT